MLVNVVFYVVGLVEDGYSRSVEGSIRADGAVRAPEVADGEIWRIVTSAFFHVDIIHIGFNMVLLWFLGTALEAYAGTLRLGIIYFASIVWASAGALYMDPFVFTLGASGGVFGLMGVAVWVELREGRKLLGGSIWGLLLLNLVITFAIPGISVGGHIGGLLGGVAAAIGLTGFGQYSLSRQSLPGWALTLGFAVLIAGAVAAIVIANAA
ncbi:MAG: rhomboid family intramembrane serine protease [Thermoleophilia bacterium]|nr:rhomboid family intramembrane serine protease [Thermoleophilia bacterium]